LQTSRAGRGSSRASPAPKCPGLPASPSTPGSPKLLQASRGRTEIGDTCLSGPWALASAHLPSESSYRSFQTQGRAAGQCPPAPGRAALPPACPSPVQPRPVGVGGSDFQGLVRDPHHPSVQEPNKLRSPHPTHSTDVLSPDPRNRSGGQGLNPWAFSGPEHSVRQWYPWRRVPVLAVAEGRRQS
jgi:hypothetical protein